MSKSLIAALVLITLVVVVILNNNSPMTLDFFYGLSWQARESLILLVFYIAGVVTGLILKGK